MITVKRLSSIFVSLVATAGLSHALGTTNNVGGGLAPNSQVIIYQNTPVASQIPQIIKLNPNLKQLILRQMPGDGSDNLVSFITALSKSGINQNIILGYVPDVTKADAGNWGCTNPATQSQCVFSKSLDTMNKINAQLKNNGINFRLSVYVAETEGSVFLNNAQTFSNLKLCLQKNQQCPTGLTTPNPGNLKLGLIEGFKKAGDTSIFNSNAADYAYLETYNMYRNAEPSWITQKMPAGKGPEVVDGYPQIRSNKYYFPTAFNNSPPTDESIYSSRNLTCAAKYYAYLAANAIQVTKQAGLLDKTFFLFSYGTSLPYLAPTSSPKSDGWTPGMYNQLVTRVISDLNNQSITDFNYDFNSDQIQFGIWSPDALYQIMNSGVTAPANFDTQQCTNPSGAN